MTDRPWQPRSAADRAKLAELVALYGPPPHPPRYGDQRWTGGTTVVTAGGWPRCLWCNRVVTLARFDHAEECPVDLAQRTRALRAAWPRALREVTAALDQIARLRAEAAALGVELPDDPNRPGGTP